MWLDVDLRTNIKCTCVWKRLDYIFKYVNYSRLSYKHILREPIRLLNEHTNFHFDNVIRYLGYDLQKLWGKHRHNLKFWICSSSRTCRMFHIFKLKVCAEREVFELGTSTSPSFMSWTFRISTHSVHSFKLNPHKTCKRQLQIRRQIEEYLQYVHLLHVQCLLHEIASNLITWGCRKMSIWSNTKTFYERLILSILCQIDKHIQYTHFTGLMSRQLLENI